MFFDLVKYQPVFNYHGLTLNEAITLIPQQEIIYFFFIKITKRVHKAKESIYPTDAAKEKKNISTWGKAIVAYTSVLMLLQFPLCKQTGTSRALPCELSFMFMSYHGLGNSHLCISQKQLLL